HLVDELVLALGRAPDGALPLPRPEARPQAVREAPRPAREARLRRDALGLPHRRDAAPRAQPPGPGDHRRRAALLAVGQAGDEGPGPARARGLELRDPRPAPLGAR